jgi:DNA (cytosine-5)-methyltransferase 1
MKTVELFAGIGGFRIAAENNGLNTVWANDACAKACKVYRDRFGKDSIVEGDITTLLDKIPSHQFLTGGFPCQPFSSAGKKQGIKDPRGTLFSTVVDLLRQHEPQYFVLENVKRLLTMERGKHFATILASLAELDYRIEWRLLNAEWFGLPQNRQRVFIAGVRHSKSDPPYSSKTRLANLADLKNRRLCVDTLTSHQEWTDITEHGARFPDWGLAEFGKFYGVDLDGFSQRKPTVYLNRVLEDDVAPEFDFTASTIERLKASTRVKRMVGGVEILSNQGGGARMGYTVFGINGLAPTLTSTASRHYERYKVGRRYRRLTNVEYARIQGFPDNQCSAVSVYHQYALFGNAVPPPMAEWVIHQTINDGHDASVLPRNARQRSLFVDA